MRRQVDRHTLLDFLKENGITRLTGERCSYGMRGLYDVTERGKFWVEGFLDCKLDRDNWNSGGVASVMMSYGVAMDLAQYIMLHHFPYVATLWPNEKDPNPTYLGISDRDELPSWSDNHLVRKGNQMPNQRHEFTGRQ